MISELNDDEMLELLITSDLSEDYSPKELKYLMFKWRYFYRILYSRYNRDKTDFIGEIEHLKNDISNLNKEKLVLEIKIADQENTINSMKVRNLTWKERFFGKISLKDINTTKINESDEI